jgi:hypothetical protein
VPASPAAASDPEERRREPRERERHQEARGVGRVGALAAVGTDGGGDDEDHEGREHRELGPPAAERHRDADRGSQQHERERRDEERLVVADRQRDGQQPHDAERRAFDELAQAVERGPPAVDGPRRHRERHAEREERDDDDARHDRAPPAEACARDGDERADRERDPRHPQEGRVAVHGPERGRGDRREEGDRDDGDDGAARVAGSAGHAGAPVHRAHDALRRSAWRRSSR